MTATTGLPADSKIAGPGRHDSVYSSETDGRVAAQQTVL